MALSKRQTIFINEYLKCWNAAEAARRAGYSEKSARVIGSENLTKPDIANAIKQRIEEQAITGDEVLARLAKQARGSMSEFVRVLDGANIPMIDWKRAEQNGMLDLVKEIKIEQDSISFKLYDAQSALVTLGKALGVLTDRTDVTSGGEPIPAIPILKTGMDVEDL